MEIGGKKHPGDSSDGLLVTPAFLIAKYQKRFNAGSGFTESVGFSLTVAFIALWSKACQRQRCFAAGNMDILLVGYVPVNSQLDFSSWR